MTNPQILAHSSHDRVRNLTPKRFNRKIDESTLQRIEKIRANGPRAVETRLRELEKEWDIDRVLMLNFSVLVFAQLIAAWKKDKRWIRGPIMQTPFLFMHATLGWCPPMLWFRPLGFRTKFEIQAEREILLGIGQAETQAA